MKVLPLIIAVLIAVFVVLMVESVRKMMFINKLKLRLAEWDKGRRRCTCKEPVWDEEAEKISPGNPLRYCRGCGAFRYDEARAEAGSAGQ